MKILEELKVIKFDKSIQKTLFNNYINFEGRSSRADAIWWFIFTLIINFGLTQIDSKYALVSTIILYFPSLSLSIRRLHDINKSGWNYFWSFTIIGIFPLIYWYMLKEGDRNKNIYGENLLFTSENNDI